MKMIPLPFSREDFKPLDSKAIWVLVLTPVCLVAIRYGGSLENAPFISKLFSRYPYSFTHNVWWALVSVFFYCAAPWLVIRYQFRQRVSEYGLSSNVLSYPGVYAIALSIVLPLVVLVSFEPHFQVTYPFYVPNDRNDIGSFLAWEVLYLLQFFGLEFFFRGFIVHGLKSSLGVYSVFVMTIPYCMIHFSKPLPECLGSIGAGLFLGMMSYKTGSIWMGAFLHMTVAIIMDVLSLWHRGYF